MCQKVSIKITVGEALAVAMINDDNFNFVVQKRNPKERKAKKIINYVCV
jgi:hypothetical protein